MELTFTIDKTLSEKDGALAITITAIPALQGKLTATTLRKLAADREKDAVAFLIQEELRYLKRASGKSDESGALFSVVHVAYPQTIAALKLLAGTGKLHFNGRPVAADFYGKTTFSFLAETADNGDVIVTGRLTSRDKEFDLRECDFICAGPPHWFIKGIFLQIIGTDITWKDLKACYYQAPLPHSYLDDALIDSDENSPRVVYKGHAEHTILQKKDPLPILMLKDRSGAFADLWLDYGKTTTPYHDPMASNGHKRQFEAEKAWEKDLLETDFIRKAMPNSHYYCPLDKVAKSLSFLLELGWQITDWKGNSVVKQSQASLEVHSQGDTILIQGTIDYGTHKAAVADVAGAFNRRERFVSLSPGTVGLLPQSWEQTPLSAVQEGEVCSSGIRLSKSQIGVLSGLMENAAYTDPVLKGLAERLQSLQRIETAPPAYTFQGQLRPYQQEGLNWLAFLYDYGLHGILADDMGLGKTVQVLAFLSRLEIEAPILIVMPTSLIFNWKREIERFLPSLSVIDHHGPGRCGETQDLAGGNIILTSYTTLRLDLELLAPLSFQCVILDEAQAIKNAQTQTAQAIFKLQSRFRLSISGTPIENHLGEIWSQFHFLIPDLLGEEQAFSSEIQAAALDTRYLQRIKKQIRPFVLRRKKEEVAKDLPEKIEQVVWVEMDPAQRTLYDDFLAGVQGNLIKKVENDGIGKHRMEILEAILRLRQICCHPLLVSTHLEDNAVLSSAKMEMLLQDMETAVEEGQKTLVYSQFTTMLGVIGKAARERGWSYAYLDGSTSDREKVVRQFQEDPSTPFFLISLKAGGIGLNLTAADYVFLFDPWWNEAVENQAIDRAHRIGRKDTVIAKRYVTIGTIEEKMMTLKAAKRTLANDLIDDDMGSPNLTQDDFMFLLT